MADFFRADTSAFSRLARDLERAAQESRPEVDRALIGIGAEHAALASEIVSEHSQSIPGTIRVLPGAGRVTIEAGDSDAPLAVLYEKGNSKGKGRGFDSRRKAKRYTSRGLQDTPSFRHPVYGRDDVWVEQQRFPFLSVAHRRLARKTRDKLGGAWAHALERNGIRVE